VNDNASVKWERGRIMFGRRGNKRRKRRRIIRDENKIVVKNSVGTEL
jgi:hypothetical protein